MRANFQLANNGVEKQRLEKLAVTLPPVPIRPMSPRIRQRQVTVSPQANNFDELYRYEYEVEEVLEETKPPTQWERIRPYVGLGGAVVAILIPLAILVKFGLNWREERAKTLNNFT